MAIEKKRMQQRYGTYQQFQDNINNLLPNEFASVISDDPNTDSGEGLYFQCGSNTPKRILTEEDKSLPVVTVIDSNSDNDHIPTEKAVYDALENKLSAADGAVKTANIDTGAVTEAKLAAAFKNTLYKVDTTARSNITSADIDSKKIYTNFTINYNGANRKAVVMNFDSTQTFIALCADGMIFTRTVGAGWQCIYNPNDKTTSITNSNKSSNILFPTIKAVVDYLTANYIGNGSGTVTEDNLATALKNSIYRVDNTTENVIYSADNQRIIYTNARVNGNKPTLIFTLGNDSQLAMYKDCHLYCRTYANGAYGSWIDLKATSISESNKTSDAYPTVRAVYNFVTTFVASAISSKANTSDVNAALTEKDEYIKLMDEKSAALDAQLTDTQLALCDVYEMMGG